ncbi:MAG TPA: hypothetical protein VFQ88_15255 [Nevskiaceae bacterium]|nr:hypothetical protein [Nevskiaceae bacterium]
MNGIWFAMSPMFGLALLLIVSTVTLRIMDNRKQKKTGSDSHKN